MSLDDRSGIIGIDFGTTKCVAAILDGGVPRPILDRAGRCGMPSVVLVTPDGELATGWEAKNHPRRYESDFVTVNSIKRIVGKQGETGWGWWKTRPQEVAALILGRLRLEVQLQLGREVTKAVIAIPAHFNFNERWAVKQAAEIAGFEVLRLLNEATAAAIRYWFSRRGKGTQTVLVFDFGGGTLDVSLVQLGDGVCEVQATAGDDRLGGDDFDDVILNHIIQQLRHVSGRVVELSVGQLAILREAATRAKVDLSSSSETRVYLPGFIPAAMNGSSALDLTVTRETFLRLSADLLARVKPLIEKVLQDGGVRAENLDAVIVVGGTSRIPTIQKTVRDILVPTSRTGGSTVLRFAPIDPESGVAEGAAILAGVLDRRVHDVLLLDATSCSLGVEAPDGGMTTLIARNTTFPTRKTEVFSTTSDNQRVVSVRILQGDNRLAADSSVVGQLELTGIYPAPRGTPKVEVTFTVDANGVVLASAKDRATGREVTTELMSPFRLNSAQVALMKREVSAAMSKIRERDAGQKEQK